MMTLLRKCPGTIGHNKGLMPKKETGNQRPNVIEMGKKRRGGIHSTMTPVASISQTTTSDKFHSGITNPERGWPKKVVDRFGNIKRIPKFELEIELAMVEILINSGFKLSNFLRKSISSEASSENISRYLR